MFLDRYRNYMAQMSRLSTKGPKQTLRRLHSQFDFNIASTDKDVKLTCNTLKEKIKDIKKNNANIYNNMFASRSKL